MGYEGCSLHLTHRGTHHCVCKGAPKLAAFLYALCQVNKTNVDTICFILVTTTLVLLAYISNQGLGNCLVSDGVFSSCYSALPEEEETKERNSPPKLMFGSCQPLLNCHSGFHLSMNTAQLLGEEMATEQQQKNYTQNCVQQCQIWLSQCWLKRQSFSGFPVRSQLVLLWIFLLHGNEAEVQRERQMARSNVTYPNVHVRQRAFWHMSQSPSSLRHVGQPIPAKCLFPSTFYSSPQQVRSYLSSVFTWIILDVFQRFRLWWARPAETAATNKQANGSQACPSPCICIHIGHSLRLSRLPNHESGGKSGNGQPQGQRFRIQVVDVCINHTENTNCGWDFQVGRARIFMLEGRGILIVAQARTSTVGIGSREREGKNVVCILVEV